MEYRRGTPHDWPGIIKLLGTTDSYPVMPETLGGHWIVAVHEGEVKGTVWFFGEAPHIHIDYLVSTSAMIAARLLALLESWCQHSGIRYIHGMVMADDEHVKRFLSEGFGCVVGGPYFRIYKEINEQDNRTSDDDTGAVSRRRASTAAS